jgi:serine/threonine protein kinase
MGAVWLARDELLHREVAVKRLRHADDRTVERAAREARLAAAADHPHIVAIYDLVDDGDDRWLVMEHVAGRTLAAVAAQDGPLAADRAARLLAQAAEGLAAAHAAGIVHRDVKPSNMLVTADDVLKLSDFGIARALDDATITRTGMVTGSPAYLSPEVARGQRATTASDVWSLGASAFHAVTGRPPYDADGNAVATLYQVVHEDPPRLGAGHPLAPLLEHTMTPEPGERWSMAQVHAFLTAVGREPADTLVAPVVATASATPPGRGRTLPALPLAVATLAVLLLLAWAVGQLGAGSDDDPGAASSSPSSTRSETPRTGAATPSPATEQPTTAGMRAFVTTYLQTATTDPKTSWEMLTPRFQKASGNFGQYQKFWRGQRSASLRSFDADPDALQVEYVVRYQRDGGPVDDRVVLGLTFDGGSYRVDSER